MRSLPKCRLHSRLRSRRLAAEGAYFKDVSGWEGADWYAGRGVTPDPGALTWRRPAFWPQWEAEQKAKAERDAAVRGERTRNEEMVGFELRGKLVAAGVRIQAWDPERRTVTFRWEDAAKLIGGSS